MNRNILKMNKLYCCGCGCCEQICPTHCITMIPDEEGFLVPCIDEQRCLNCGRCYDKCAQVEYDMTKSSIQKVFAARSKDNCLVESSSSGGIFGMLSKYILSLNGCIFGCAWDNKLEAKHIKVSSEKDLERLFGSKYVQSIIGNVYVDVKKSLEENKYVLFSGTACQIAGLNNYLGKKYDKLFTVDVICHGVPSQELFRKYIMWLEKRTKDTIIKYDFRYKKRNGWGLNYKAKGLRKRVIRSGWLDPYYSAFLNCDTYRECCYSCKYANKNRISDITLGDFWGIEREHPDFYNDMGVSAVIINTEKGQQLFESIEEQILCIESSFDKVARQNNNLLRPSVKSAKRDELKKFTINEYESLFDSLLHIKISIYQRIKYFVPVRLKRIIKRIIKK